MTTPELDGAGRDAAEPPHVELVATERARLQRRTVRVLVVAQVVGGLGIGVGVAVGTLAARELSGSDAWAGATATMQTLGAAVLALVLARLAGDAGRRRALAVGWVLAAVGAGLSVLALVLGWFPLLVLGFGLFGASSAVNLQSRYAAADLALPDHLGRALSLVLWATTVGAVLGPNIAAPAARVFEDRGWPPMAGPMALSSVAFVLAAAALQVWLRPDPLRAALALAPPGELASRTKPATAIETAVTPSSTGTLRRGVTALRASPQARLAVLVLITAQAVMVAVMAMTPVHMTHHGATLTIVGLTISLHVAGMYALSPVFGWLADRHGGRVVMVLGMLLLVAACGTAAAARGTGMLLPTGLVLLGLGWSAAMVAASTELSEAVAVDSRAGAQGVADSSMGLAGALAAGLSGVVLATAGFGGLCLVAALLTVPALVILATRR